MLVCNHFRWEIVTKGYDIGFGLYYKPLGQTEKLHAGEMEAKVKWTMPWYYYSLCYKLFYN